WRASTWRRCSAEARSSLHLLRVTTLRRWSAASVCDWRLGAAHGAEACWRGGGLLPVFEARATCEGGTQGLPQLLDGGVVAAERRCQRLLDVSIAGVIHRVGARQELSIGVSVGPLRPPARAIAQRGAIVAKPTVGWPRVVPGLATDPRWVGLGVRELAQDLRHSELMLLGQHLELA